MDLDNEINVIHNIRQGKDLVSENWKDSLSLEYVKFVDGIEEKLLKNNYQRRENYKIIDMIVRICDEARDGDDGDDKPKILKLRDDDEPKIKKIR